MTAAAAAAVVCTLLLAWRRESPAVELGLHQCLGQALAQRAARMVGKQGRILTITVRAPQSTALKIQMESFKAELIKLGDYEVREFELTNTLAAKQPLGAGLSWLEYRRAIEDNRSIDLIVSFAGAPALEQSSAALPSAPKLIAECASPAYLRALFGRKLISEALVPRDMLEPARGYFFWRTTHSESADNCVSRQYQIVTPAQASALPRP